MKTVNKKRAVKKHAPNRQNPLNTCCNNNVVIASKRRHFDVFTSKWRRFDAITTSLLCHMFAGKQLELKCPSKLIDAFFHVIRCSAFKVFSLNHTKHYHDVIMGTIASQITSLAVVYSIVYSDVDQRKHQSSASLAFVWGIHRDRWIPRTKGQLRGKCFHLMTSTWVSESNTHISLQPQHPFEIILQNQHGTKSLNHSGQLPGEYSICSQMHFF